MTEKELKQWEELKEKKKEYDKEQKKKKADFRKLCRNEFYGLSVEELKIIAKKYKEEQEQKLADNSNNISSNSGSETDEMEFSSVVSSSARISRIPISQSSINSYHS